METEILSYNEDHEAEQQLWEGYVNLSDEEKISVHSLHGYDESRAFDSSSLKRISELNGFTKPPTGAAVFLQASRFNHDCDYNAAYRYHRTLKAATIHTITDIPKGDEITVSYIDTRKPSRERQLELRQYGFTCECNACKGGSNDSRRLRISQLDSEIGMAELYGQSQIYKLGLVKEQEKLIQMEGIDGMLGMA